LIAAKVVEYNVGNLDKSVEHISSRGISEVESNALLVAIEGLIEEAVTVLLVGSDFTRRVSARGRVFDLDDLGTQVCQVHRSVRARAVLGYRNNPYPFERERQTAHQRLTSERRKVAGRRQKRKRDRLRGPEKRASSTNELDEGAETLMLSVLVLNF